MTHTVEPTQLAAAFQAALTTAFGPCTLAHALRACAQDIRTARTGGASWEAIAVVLSMALQDAGRPPLTAATLRGMMRRCPTKRAGHGVPPRLETARSKGMAELEPAKTELTLRTPMPRSGTSNRGDRIALRRRQLLEVNDDG